MHESGDPVRALEFAPAFPNQQIHLFKRYHAVVIEEASSYDSTCYRDYYVFQLR